MNSKKELKLSTTILASFLSLIPVFAQANIEGVEFKAGNGHAEQNGNVVDIYQTTHSGILECRKLDIAAHEAAHFHQPDATSVTLARVKSNSASHIDGILTANGNLVIVNQHGIVFGKGAKVDVNGLIATTIDIDNDKFMREGFKYEFNKAGLNDAAIINHGNITAKDAGLVGFVAARVENHGVIVANSGSVQLASGDNFTVDMYGDKLIEVSVAGDLKEQLIVNKGLLEADGGKIIITAAAGKEIVNSIIDIQGELKAPSVKEKNGEIIIYAEGSNAVKGNVQSDKGKKQGNSTVLVTADIDVSGEKGGRVIINGDNIALLNGTKINASGLNGKTRTTNGKHKADKREGSAGGDIQIGGDYKGEGTTPTAKNVYIDENVVILNDAINSGDAGRTIIWSDDTTEFHNNIYARAFGDDKGLGGFVETSGKKQLIPFGVADVTSKTGETGIHLLDPTNIKIYGNVDPQFVSTDESISLASKLKLWLDASDSDTVTLSYVDSLSGMKVSGSTGSNTLSLYDTSGQWSFILPGNKIAISTSPGDVSASATASNIYTVASVSSTTITLTNNLNADYSSESLFLSYVKGWTDQSGQGNDASQVSSPRMPFWLENQQNSLPVLKFDGLNDQMSVNLAFLNDESFGDRGIPHTNFFTAKTTEFGSFYYNSASDGGVYEGFESGPEYRMDYILGDDTLDYIGVASGSKTPSSSFDASGYNVVTFKWLPDSAPTPDNLNTKYIYANTHEELTSYPAGTIGPHTDIDYIGGNTGAYWGGGMSEIMMYTANLPTDQINLLNQYESAKWNIPLSPGGYGYSEAEKAMDSGGGYSLFAASYLTRLSNSANIELSADSDITLDLKGANLTLASDKNFSLTSYSGNITAVSSGQITTTRATTGGNITMLASYGSGTIDVSSVTLTANNGGVVTLTGVVQVEETPTSSSSSTSRAPTRTTLQTARSEMPVATFNQITNPTPVTPNIANAQAFTSLKPVNNPPLNIDFEGSEFTDGPSSVNFEELEKKL